MPDIYLHSDGQQQGPYQPEQLRQLLAEGKTTAETPAWYEGLNAWSTVSQVLGAFPPATLPPAFPPLPVPAAPPKKGMPGWQIAVIIGVVGFVGLFVVSCLAGIALGPITKGIEKAKESASLQSARAIDLAMFAYASDHNGAYPDGASSTEVFQKLVDEKYISDTSIFYIFSVPGKTKATSNKLLPENVCYDVTSGIDSTSPDDLPVVFSTGYTITYADRLEVARNPGTVSPFPGIAVAYKNNAAHFWSARTDGTIPSIVPESFSLGPKIYRQLTP